MTKLGYMSLHPSSTAPQARSPSAAGTHPPCAAQIGYPRPSPVGPPVPRPRPVAAACARPPNSSSPSSLSAASRRFRASPAQSRAAHTAGSPQPTVAVPARPQLPASPVPAPPRLRTAGARPQPLVSLACALLSLHCASQAAAYRSSVSLQISSPPHARPVPRKHSTGDAFAPPVPSLPVLSESSVRGHCSPVFLNSPIQDINWRGNNPPTIFYA